VKADPDEAKKLLKNGIPVYDFYLITALKKNNKTTALGKKQIVEDLAPVFSKISNKVLLDHYTKELAEETDISIDTIYSMLKKGEAKKEEDVAKELEEENVVERINIEGYLVSLLLKSPIEISQKFAIQVKKEDFEDLQLSEIFEALSEYIEGRKTDINIKTFVSKLDEDKSKMVSDLYLNDLNGKEELAEKLLVRDLKNIIERVKKESTKRQLKVLSEEIKIAETEKKSEEVERLSKKFEKLSKSLL
jgi:DNA primase